MEPSRPIRPVIVGAMVVALALSSLAPVAAARRDSDGDGMPDRWERRHGLDPTRRDARWDPDRDGLANLVEYRNRSDPRLQDTDGDGSDDRDEVRDFSTSPRNPDSDGDGVLDGDDDDDGNGVSDEDADDAVEICRGRDDRDSDRDGLDDEDENDFGTDPRVADSDGDGVVDGNQDRDGDGVWDEDADDDVRDFCYFDQGEDFDDVVAPGAMGRVLAGPTCPVQREDDPSCNDRPLEGAEIVVEDRVGREVARAVTSRDGRFAFSLEPGEYRLTPLPDEDGQPRPEGPQDVVVEAGTLVEVTLHYDTGIR